MVDEVKLFVALEAYNLSIGVSRVLPVIVIIRSCFMNDNDYQSFTAEPEQAIQKM
jgi:hypothetical protein